MEVLRGKRQEVKVETGLMWAALVGTGIASAIRIRVRVRKRIHLSTSRPGSRIRPFSLIGLAIACASPAGASERRFPLPPGNPHDAPAPPWSGEGFPPPQPLVRTSGGVPHGEERGADRGQDQGRTPTAIHSPRSERTIEDPVPLFPRVGREHEPPTPSMRARQKA